MFVKHWTSSVAVSAYCRWAALYGAVLLLSSLTRLTAASELPSYSSCDRELRKTFENIQSWRRTHNGRYPDYLTDIRPGSGGTCPANRAELLGASVHHGLATSRGEGRDPESVYEYEMSAVEKSNEYPGFLPQGAFFTRGQLKAELLRRAYWEQVAILRCSAHHAAAPAALAKEKRIFRNLTATGDVYWSGDLWEQQWLDTVPYCSREANALFGLKGPLFYTNRPPTIATALDLRPWICAFGDHAWWWTLPLFDVGTNRQQAPHLRPLFQEQHGRTIELAGTFWWLNGLVQLQGRVVDDDRYVFAAPRRRSFVWERTGLAVTRRIRTASWLQGTVWRVKPGETVGWLVWHFVDGNSERVPLIYGKTTARFWATKSQSAGEAGFPDPVWKHDETQADFGKDRQLRLYQQTWNNPRPDVTVSSVDFISNTNSTAAPFLIAVNIWP